MNIRKATKEDFSEMLNIYKIAREYMKANGNPNQWEDNRPPEASILKDIENENSYVIEENDVIYGVFSLILGDDPTYEYIENGKWHSNKPYGTIHKLASSGKKSGIAKLCFEYCDKVIDHLRIDTHADNKTMQAVIKAYGFEECGIIYVDNGPRVAFDRVRK